MFYLIHSRSYVFSDNCCDTIFLSHKNYTHVSNDRHISLLDFVHTPHTTRIITINIRTGVKRVKITLRPRQSRDEKCLKRIPIILYIYTNNNIRTSASSGSVSGFVCVSCQSEIKWIVSSPIGILYVYIIILISVRPRVPSVAVLSYTTRSKYNNINKQDSDFEANISFFSFFFFLFVSDILIHYNVFNFHANGQTPFSSL